MQNKSGNKIGHDQQGQGIDKQANKESHGRVLSGDDLPEGIIAKKKAAALVRPGEIDG
jgi:hypothetical protein